MCLSRDHRGEKTRRLSQQIYMPLHISFLHEISRMYVKQLIAVRPGVNHKSFLSFAHQSIVSFNKHHVAGNKY